MTKTAVLCGPLTLWRGTQPLILTHPLGETWGWDATPRLCSAPRVHELPTPFCTHPRLPTWTVSRPSLHGDGHHMNES